MPWQYDVSGPHIEMEGKPSQGNNCFLEAFVSHFNVGGGDTLKGKEIASRGKLFA